MNVRGKIQDGRVVLEQPLPLADGTEVQVVVAPVVPQPAAEPQQATLFERLRGMIGVARGLPSDLAENHDHYARGTPSGTDRE